MDHVRFPLGLLSGPRDASRSLVGPFVIGDPDRSRGTSAVDCVCSAGFPPLPPRLRDTPAPSPGCSQRGPSAQSRRLPRESFDALEDLPKEASGQVCSHSAAIVRFASELWVEGRHPEVSQILLSGLIVTTRRDKPADRDRNGPA